MIYILHGRNFQASYARLSQILEKYKPLAKIRLDEKSSNDEVVADLYGTDLFGEQKLLIFENYLAGAPKIDFEGLKQLKDKIIVFWEKSTLTKSLISKLPKGTQIEQFKPEPAIFWFLDNLYPKNGKVLSLLDKVNERGLLYQLQNRLLLMVLSKLGATYDYAKLNMQKNLQNWQFEKIKRQAASFTLNNLFSIYSGALKIDYMIKKGQTDLADTTLIKLLLLKYL